MKLLKNNFLKGSVFLIALLISSFFIGNVFAGGSLSGTGTLKHEKCTEDNLLTLGTLQDGRLNVWDWPYRVETPEYCIHIYPDTENNEKGKFGEAQFFYALPKAARAKTDFYDKNDYLKNLDDIANGSAVFYNFPLHCGPLNNEKCLIQKSLPISDSLKEYTKIKATDLLKNLSEEERFKKIDLKDLFFDAYTSFEGFSAGSVNEVDLSNTRADYKGQGVVQMVTQSFSPINKNGVTVSTYLELRKYKDVLTSHDYFVSYENIVNVDTVATIANIGDEAVCYTTIQGNVTDRWYPSACLFRYKNITLTYTFSFDNSGTISSEVIAKKMFDFSKPLLTHIEKKLYSILFLNNQQKSPYILKNYKKSSNTNQTEPSLTQPLSPPPAGFEDEVITTEYKNPFSDTTLDSLKGRAAAELYRRAIIGGYPDGEFKGIRSVNRAEAAKFLLLSLYGKVADAKNNGRFKDVLDGQWYIPFIVMAAEKGIISGHPDGTFRPGDTVNTAEFLKMLALTFNLQEEYDPSIYTDVVKTDWFSKYSSIAHKYNLFPDRTASGNRLLEPNRLLTRDEVAVAIYQYLQSK